MRRDWNYSPEAWVFKSRSSAFGSRRHIPTESSIFVNDANGTMVLSSSREDRTQRRIVWETKQVTYSVGRTGKVSFRKRQMKVVPEGSRTEWGYHGSEDRYRAEWVDGDEDAPRIIGHHMLDPEWETSVQQVTVKV